MEDPKDIPEQTNPKAPFQQPPCSDAGHDPTSMSHTWTHFPCLVGAASPAWGASMPLVALPFSTEFSIGGSKLQRHHTCVLSKNSERIFSSVFSSHLQNTAAYFPCHGKGQDLGYVPISALRKYSSMAKGDSSSHLSRSMELPKSSSPRLSPPSPHSTISLFLFSSHHFHIAYLTWRKTRTKEEALTGKVP